MKNETYNGWTNYATWRVNLEIFAGLPYDNDGAVTPEECQGYAEGFSLDYSLAFLREVNWQEIAAVLNEQLSLNA